MQHIVLVTLPPILVNLGIVQPPQFGRYVKQSMACVKHLDYGRWRKMRRCSTLIQFQGQPAHFVRSHIHHSLWFIAQGKCVPPSPFPPFDHTKRSDEWTSALHSHMVIGFMGVCVDDLLIAGPCALNEALIKVVQEIWKNSTPEHVGPDADSVPVLRFWGVSLERVEPYLSINFIWYIVEVLMKFESSLQLKSRTAPPHQV